VSGGKKKKTIAERHLSHKKHKVPFWRRHTPQGGEGRRKVRGKSPKPRENEMLAKSPKGGQKLGRP